MTLARPEYAWLFALLPVAFLGIRLKWKHRRRLAALVPTPRRTVRLARDGCFLAGLAFLALAATGPGMGQAPADAPRTSGRLVVALDCSKSMWAKDLSPDRLTAAKAAIRDILARLPDIQAGLVVFAGKAQLACPVTNDRPGLLLFLDAAGPAALPVGGTNLTAALEAAKLALLGAPGVILLVTDGEATTAAADAVRKTSVPVVTLAVGGAAPVTVPDGSGGLLRDAQDRPVQVGVDAAGLADLANTSGGSAFRLSPQTAGPAKDTARTLAGLLTHGSGGATGTARPTDRTTLCLLLGLTLLLLHLIDIPLGRSGAAVLALCGLGLAFVPRPILAATTAADAVSQGLSAMAAGQFDAARDHFLDARSRYPDAPTILFDLGTAYYRLGQFDRAVTAFDQAAKTASSASLRAAARYNQGNAAYRLGKIDQAIALYEAALRLAPNDADARANLQFLRAAKTPAPTPSNQPRPDGEKASRPDQGGTSQASGTATRPGKAPDAQGKDTGTGASNEPPEGTAQSDAPTGPSSDPNAPAVPLADRQGMAAGIKRTAPDATPGTPLLDKVPDLPGLPIAVPHYGQTNVEKDW